MTTKTQQMMDVATQVQAKLNQRSAMSLEDLSTSITTTTSNDQEVPFGPLTLHQALRTRHAVITTTPAWIVKKAITVLSQHGRVDVGRYSDTTMVSLPGTDDETIYDLAVRAEDQADEASRLAHPGTRFARAEDRRNRKLSPTLRYVDPAPLTDPEELHASEVEDAYLAEGKVADCPLDAELSDLCNLPQNVRAPVPSFLTYDETMKLSALTRYEATTPAAAAANFRAADKKRRQDFLNSPEGQLWLETKAAEDDAAMATALASPVVDRPVVLPDEDDDVFAAAFGPVAQRAKGTNVANKADVA